MKKGDISYWLSVISKKITVKLSGFILVALIIGISLAGCGGGGGDSHDDGPNPPTSYRALGVGVIIQGQDNTGSNFSVGSNEAFTKPDVDRKWIDLAPGCLQPRIQPAKVFGTAAVSQEFLEQNSALILLAWDKVNDADHYHIYYGSTKVWESDKVNQDEDPGFNPNNPQAYLDLDHELSGKITEAGEYQFLIVAVNADDTEGTCLPEVSASLGMVLGQIPQNIGFTNPELTWDSVSNAQEYKITVFNGDQYETSTFIFPDITRTASYNVSSIPSIGQGYYRVWVDARCLDGLGNLKEIIRGYSGFDY